MSDKVDVSLEYDGDHLGATGGEVVCRIKLLDQDLIGHDARLSIVAEIDVKDRRPVNVRKEVFSRDIVLSADPIEILISRETLRAYSYSGEKITISLHTQLKIDDGIFFDTRIKEEEVLDVGSKPGIKIDANSIAEPSDSFSILKNLNAIPAESRVITIVLMIVGVVVIGVNMLVGVHDQLSPEAATWLYSHRSSDGDSSSPFMNALAGSGAVGAALWVMIRRQLRRYMSFRLKPVRHIDRQTSYVVSDLVEGQSRIPLHDVTLRVIACNIERGQYKRKSGKKTRTRSFEEPTRGVILYEATAGTIPANVPVATYFSGSVDFQAMFDKLYPPFLISQTHGLDVHWEVQLLHPELVDQELTGPTKMLRYEDFIN